MSYIRQPLLSKEEEIQLRLKMIPKWNQKPKLSGREIARQLGFGVPGSPYFKIPPHYIFFYRQKFNNIDKKHHRWEIGELPIRRQPAFAKKTTSANDNLRRTRYKYPPKKLGLMSTKHFIKKINKLPNSIWHRRIKAFLVLMYWIPLRSSEFYSRRIEDFKITPTHLIINLLREKKGHVEGDELEPAKALRVLPFMEDAITFLESEEWKLGDMKIEENNKVKKRPNTKYPFNFGYGTALNYAKLVYGKKYYCHYFRFRWISEEASQPGVKLSDLTIKVSLSPAAASKYIFTPEKREDEMDQAKLERLRKEGVIK